MTQESIAIRKHKASISLACEFLATVLRILSRTFARHSCECRENFLVSRTGREVFQHVEKFYANFFSKIFRKTVARLSCDGRVTFVRVSRTCRCEILANLQCEIFATPVRMSRECRTTSDSLAKTSRLSGEKIKLSDIRTNVARHSHECRATVVRISMKISYIRGKVVRHSHECRATIARLTRDSRAIYFQN